MIQIYQRVSHQYFGESFTTISRNTKYGYEIKWPTIEPKKHTHTNA